MAQTQLMRTKWISSDGTYDLNPTEHNCASCGEALSYTEEVFLLSVVQAQLIDGRIEYYDVLDDSGDFAYIPYFFEFVCWESIEEDLKDRAKDVPPIVDNQSLLECAACESDIRAWETLGLVSFGELHSSRRTPDGPSTIFTEMGDKRHVCISCLYTINDVGQFWENGMSEGYPGYKACEEGIHARCWRMETCSCRELTGRK